MDWGQIKTQAVWAVMLAFATSALGWMFAMNQNGTAMAKADKLEAHLGEVQAQLDNISRTQAGRRTVVGDASSRIEFLCNRDDACRQRFQPMQLPEWYPKVVALPSPPV